MFSSIFSSDFPQFVELKKKTNFNLIGPKKFLLRLSDENGILLPKLFWPTVRKNCSTDREKLLKFEVEYQCTEMTFIVRKNQSKVENTVFWLVAIQKRQKSCY